MFILMFTNMYALLPRKQNLNKPNPDSHYLWCTKYYCAFP